MILIDGRGRMNVVPTLERQTTLAKHEITVIKVGDRVVGSVQRWRHRVAIPHWSWTAGCADLGIKYAVASHEVPSRESAETACLEYVESQLRRAP